MGLNLKRLGTGVEQVLMAAYVGATQPVWSVVAMEEPEAGLHPGAQRLLLQHLLDWARTRLLVVSTHSTVFLDHANPELTQTHLVTRAGGIATLSTDVEDDVEILERVGVRLSDVASAERVLMVEGDSDEDVLRAWFGPRLIRAGISIVPMGGGDKAWHTATILEVLDQADRLRREVRFLRDRDELDPTSLQRLESSGGVHVLARRELENYLMDPEAIAQVLDGATPESVQAAMDPAIDATRARVLLKSATARLPPIRTPDCRGIERLAAAGAGLDELVAVARELAAADDLEARVRGAWAEASSALDADWPTRKAELAPGEEVLRAIFEAHGRSYDKKRDGPRIAAAMTTPPAELDQLITQLEQAVPGASA